MLLDDVHLARQPHVKDPGGGDADGRRTAIVQRFGPDQGDAVGAGLPLRMMKAEVERLTAQIEQAVDSGLKKSELPPSSLIPVSPGESIPE